MNLPRNRKRFLAVAALGALLVTAITELFPGLLTAFYQLLIPAYVTPLSLPILLFAGYFLILVFLGVVFLGIPRIWSLLLSLAVIVVAVVFLSPEAAIVDVFGILLAILEGWGLREFKSVGGKIG